MTISISYRNVQPSDAERLVDLELRCFPTTDPEDLLSVEGVLMQCERFPEGGHVALDREVIVGFSMGCFVDFDFENPQHHIDDVVGELGSDKHDPNGAWYYGTDIAVLPNYRGNGIGRRLYDLRKDLVRRENRAGIVAGGVIPGYADHKHLMSADEYVAKVVAGELFDPTLSFQIANGFEARCALAGYMRDEAVDNWAALIVWKNPEHDAEKFSMHKRSA
ncbi:MAG: GNAT family N-acetyltransferase [Acidimicrobiia bacterium]|nr:GNAT family N-acetyltransferase [Acidimicrobiia bacterium]